MISIVPVINAGGKCGKEVKMSEENAKIEQIKKSSKAALVVSNISKVLTIMGSGISLISGFLVFRFRREVNEALASWMEQDYDERLNGVEEIVGRAVVEKGYGAETLAIYLVTTAAALVCMALVFHFVAKTFKNIRESYSPFQPQTVKNLRISFVLITVLTIRSSLMIALLIGFAGWCVVNIFQYGCELQKQSDETL